MLVDAGGYPVFGKRPTRPPIDIGEEVVSPYLFRRGIRGVDIVIATHAHEDHIGGLRALVENFRPRELWTGAFPDAGPWVEQRRWIESRGVRIRAPKAGQSELWDGVRVDVLSPSADYPDSSTARNNDSLVLRLSLGARSILLTGDVERQMEYEMVDLGRVTPVDILKVAHHGSKTSSTPEFLDAARPRWAVISAGYLNLFRHPHTEVLHRLRDRGIEVWRTDEQGLVRMLTNGKGGWRIESVHQPPRP